MACEQGEAVGSINPYALDNKTLRLLSVVKLSHLKLTLRIRETVKENIQFGEVAEAESLRDIFTLQGNRRIWVVLNFETPSLTLLLYVSKS